MALPVVTRSACRSQLTTCHLLLSRCAGLVWSSATPVPACAWYGSRGREHTRGRPGWFVQVRLRCELGLLTSYTGHVRMPAAIECIFRVVLGVRYRYLTFQLTFSFFSYEKLCAFCRTHNLILGSRRIRLHQGKGHST